MSKTIVILSDGTGNAASSPHKTNVWRLYKALEVSSGSQVAIYDDGVGTSSFLPFRLLGLAFGFGLKKNVRELYRQLSQVYNPGDRIAIFGFSRGAFTARVLAALIVSQGIVDRSVTGFKLQICFFFAYLAFRVKAFDPALVTLPLWWLSERVIIPRVSKRIPIHPNTLTDEQIISVLGVWDTVDAYGAPIDEITRAWDLVVVGLNANNRNLSSKVGAAYQALALDEPRETFNPMLWNEAPAKTADGQTKAASRAPEQILEQVWFAGVHANIGGGYPDDSLAHVSLIWMMEKCGDHEISFKEGFRESYELAADPLGPIYNNRSGMGNVYRLAPRKVEELCNNLQNNWRDKFKRLISGRLFGGKHIVNEVKIDLPKIHQSVFDRIERGSDGYAPIGMPQRYCVVNNKGECLDQTDAKKSLAHIEAEDVAQVRRTVQGEIWYKIWCAKLIHLVTFFGAIAWAFYPSFAHTGANGSSRTAAIADPFFGGVGDFIRGVAGLIGSIPGLSAIDDWAKSYQAHPYIFAFGALALLLGVFLSNLLTNSTKTSMRLQWVGATPEAKVNSRSSDRRAWKQAFFDTRLVETDKGSKLRTCVMDRLRGGFRSITEFVVVILFLTISVLFIWRICYVWDDASGNVCKQTKQERAWEKETIALWFNSSDPCFDTGAQMEEGVEYEITFEIAPPWRDKSLKADVLGWMDLNFWIRYPMAGYKRHLSKDWYEPIARVGTTWFDRYSLSETQRDRLSKTGRPINTATLTFTARSNGRLFLYLNDAVLPGFVASLAAWFVGDESSSLNCFSQQHSGRWWAYGNNCGRAQVKILRKRPKPGVEDS